MNSTYPAAAAAATTENERQTSLIEYKLLALSGALSNSSKIIESDKAIESYSRIEKSIPFFLNNVRTQKEIKIVSNKITVIIKCFILPTEGYSDTPKARADRIKKIIKHYSKTERERLTNIISSPLKVNPLLFNSILTAKHDNPPSIVKIEEHEIEIVVSAQYEELDIDQYIEDIKIMKIFLFNIISKKYPDLLLTINNFIKPHELDNHSQETASRLFQIVNEILFMSLHINFNIKFIEEYNKGLSKFNNKNHDNLFNQITDPISDIISESISALEQLENGIDKTLKNTKTLAEFEEMRSKIIKKLNEYKNTFNLLIDQSKLIDDFLNILQNLKSQDFSTIASKNSGSRNILDSGNDVIQSMINYCDNTVTKLKKNYEKDGIDSIEREKEYNLKQEKKVSIDSLVSEELIARIRIIKERNLNLDIFQQQTRKLKIVPEQKDPLPPEHNPSPKKLIRAAAAAAASDSDSDSAITKTPDFVEINTIINNKAVNLVENSNLFKLGTTENCFVTNHGLADIDGALIFDDILKTGRVLTEKSRNKTGIKLYKSGIAAAKTMATGEYSGARLVLVPVIIDSKTIYFPHEVKDHKEYENLISNTESQSKVINNFRSNFVVSGSDKVKPGC